MGAGISRRTLAVIAAACITMAVAGVAWAAPKPKENGKPVHPVHPTKPAEEPQSGTGQTSAPSTGSPATATPKAKAKAVTQAKPTTGGGSAKDPRDPGSAQERGRGNAGDIDPFRGPDASGNTPARGNDCDEGGGNNRTTFPRRENGSNGDSDVDNDRGGGNNRCGAAPSTNPPGEPNNPPGKPDTPGESSQQPGETPSIPLGTTLPEQTSGTTPDESGTSPESGSGGSDNPVVNVGPARVRLPFTGAELLWIALIGCLLTALGLGLRRGIAWRPALAGSVGEPSETLIPASIPAPAIVPAPRPVAHMATDHTAGESRAVRLMLLGAAAGGVALALRRRAGH